MHSQKISNALGFSQLGQTPGVLLLPGHVSGTACQHTCAMKTFLITVSGVNLRRHIGFNVASGAQCDILLNCAIEIFLLNWTEPQNVNSSSLELLWQSLKAKCPSCNPTNSAKALKDDGFPTLCWLGDGNKKFALLETLKLQTHDQQMLANNCWPTFVSHTTRFCWTTVWWRRGTQQTTTTLLQQWFV